MIKSLLTYSVVLSALIHSAPVQAYEDKNLILQQVRYPQVEIPIANATVAFSSKIVDVNLRAGYYLENNNVEFKGCVLYLEGLSDSVANHIPLYKALSAQGYRTIFFDYFGQGGSESSMNNTRIVDPVFPALRISNQAKFIWNYFSTTKDQTHNRSCENSKKRVIGWSTGGLATYGLAHEGWAEAVVLIAPGIQPQTLVGEAATQPELLALLKPIITLRTLTTASYDSADDNPHLDKISPNSPAIVPLFATNLVLSSVISKHWQIPKSVAGLVFLSGPNDTYVYAQKTVQTLQANSDFSIVTYEKALHEIDNEVAAISDDFRKRVVEFFNAN